MGLFDLLRRRTSHKAVFCGLDNSGKTTIITFLKEGKFVQHYPTMGKQKREMIVEGTKIIIFDMGGQSQFRKMWLGELNDSKCVVYVIDKADKNRYLESKKEFDRLVPLIKRKNLKLLVLANKYDLDTTSNLEEITEIFQLTQLDNFEIALISARTGFGMADAFTKFYRLLTGQYIEKIKVARSIGIYSMGGHQILFQAREDLNLSPDYYDNLLPTLIKNFSKNASKRLRSKLENGYILILLKKESIIGSILWHPDLKVPLEESESSLNELLEHVEKMPNVIDAQDLAFQVMQYTTNLM